jgi:UDP-N-acetylmuramoyl-tripeptide--D-alanyl-D-alanine ligase
MKLSLERALHATGAMLYDGEAAPDAVRISTDTRTMEAGDTFLALHGEHYDGHDFVGEALARGAAMLILDRAAARVSGTPTMLVDQTQRAYMALAGAARELFGGHVVGITGSTGKTTTKALMAQLLSSRYRDRILAAPANENNEIGVSKLLLNASNELHDVLVVEMGARRYGDVASLVEIARPQLGILTNVGDAHVEVVGSRERLAETKWALFARGARAVLNADDEVSCRRSPTLPHPPHWFVALHTDGRMEDYANCATLTALIGDRLFHRKGNKTQELTVDVRVPGLHNRSNLAAAIAGALELGASLDRIGSDVGQVVLPEGRYERISVDGLRLIYDAYNANASGTIAALDAFADESGTRRIAVLASMAELGDESEMLHERVGEHAARRVDVLLVQGEFARALVRGAQRGGLAQERIVDVATNSHAAAWLRQHAGRDDVVLLKGSRKYKLEEIVEELRA